MFDRQHGQILFECDGGCGEVMNTGTASFSGALSLLKAESWSLRRFGDNWSHFCPGCRPVHADPFGVFGERHR
jgi:hypothetical protein